MTENKTPAYCYYYNERRRFCLEFEHLREQPAWFTVYQWRTEKDWFVTNLILLPHMPALFMTSPMPSGHKMAALTFLFLWLSLVLKHSLFRTRHRVKDCCVYINKEKNPILSISLVMLLQFGSPLTSDLFSLGVLCSWQVSTMNDVCVRDKLTLCQGESMHWGTHVGYWLSLLVLETFCS